MQSDHEIQAGETLRSIARDQLGDSNRWRELYNMNRIALEQAAREAGFSSSLSGRRVFPGTNLIL